MEQDGSFAATPRFTLNMIIRIKSDEMYTDTARQSKIGGVGKGVTEHFGGHAL